MDSRDSLQRLWQDWLRLMNHYSAEKETFFETALVSVDSASDSYNGLSCIDGLLDAVGKPGQSGEDFDRETKDSRMSDWQSAFSQSKGKLESCLAHDCIVRLETWLMEADKLSEDQKLLLFVCAKKIHHWKWAAYFYKLGRTKQARESLDKVSVDELSSFLPLSDVRDLRLLIDSSKLILDASAFTPSHQNMITRGQQNEQKDIIAIRETIKSCRTIPKLYYILSCTTLANAQNRHEWNLALILTEFLDCILSNPKLRPIFLHVASRIKSAKGNTAIQSQLLSQTLCLCIYQRMGRNSTDSFITVALSTIENIMVLFIFSTIHIAGLDKTDLSPIVDFCTQATFSPQNLTKITLNLFSALSCKYHSIFQYLTYVPENVAELYRVRLNIGISAFKYEQYDLCAVLLSDYDQKVGGTAEVYNLLGAILSIKGEPKEAISLYQRAIKANPNFLLPLYNILYEYKAAKNPKVCTHLIDFIMQSHRKLIIEPSLSSRYFLLPDGSVRLSKHHPLPTLCELHLLGATIFQEAQEWEMSMNHYRALLDSIATSSSISDSDEGYEELVVLPFSLSKQVDIVRDFVFVLLRCQRADEALRYCGHLIEYDPCDVVAFNLMADALIQLCRYRAALEKIERAIEILDIIEKVESAEEMLSGSKWVEKSHLLPKLIDANMNIFVSKQTRRELSARTHLNKSLCMMAVGDILGESHLKASWEKYPESRDLNYNYCLSQIKAGEHMNAALIWLEFNKVDSKQSSTFYADLLHTHQRKKRNSKESADELHEWVLSYYRDHVKKQEMERELAVAEELFCAFEDDDNMF